MGQFLHGSARTTEAVRRALQLRQESVRALARRYGVSPTTVQKWRKRETTTDARWGRRSRARGCSPLRRRRSSSPSAVTRCCRSMTASMACSRASRASRGRRCTAASSVTASAACPISEATSRSAASSPITRSATSTLTSPRFERSKASSTCSSQSTGRPSWPS